MKGYSYAKAWMAGWALILCCILLAGCSRQADGEREKDSDAAQSATGTEAAGSAAVTGGVTYYDIQAEENAIFDPLFGPERSGNLLGMQYYQGEPVQIWALRKVLSASGADEEPVVMFDIALKKTDGSSALLLENAPGRSGYGDWFLAQDGSFYCITTNYDENRSTLVKRDASGEVVYEKEQDMQVRDICQLADGRIILLLYAESGLNSIYRLAELKPETGTVSDLNHIMLERLSQYSIAAGDDGLLLMEKRGGIWKVDMESGSMASIMSFTNTAYEAHDNWGFDSTMHDFRTLADGGMEILFRDTNGGGGVCEKLQMVEISKIPVVIRAFHFNDGWISGRIAAFNESDDTYQIVMEEPGEGIGWDDFSRQTSIEIATGKGPDLLYGKVLDDYIQGMIDKGGFEDLRPYMESTGIREEDYFPAAFNCWRKGDEIYGANAEINAHGLMVNADLLGGNRKVDIETLVDALLAWPEKAMYALGFDSGDILESFLEGSDTLWGMIDWEQGTCNFSGELFAKMLEAARRYPYDEKQDYPILADTVPADHFYYFGSSVVQEKDNLAVAGTLFDDGCYPNLHYGYQILAINSNSSKKQGAWEFIRFLLGEESQMALAKSGTPVSREAFAAALERQLEYVADGKVAQTGSYTMRMGKYVTIYEREYTQEDVTDAWIEEYVQAMEDARPLPIRTEPILEIILDEAEDYFNGVKSAEEVAAVVKSRAQVYIDENY